MNVSLQRYSASLLLFCVFSAVRTTYGQTTDYWELSRAGRAEYWAGHYEKAETLLRRALEVTERNRDEYAIATTHGDLGTVYQNEERALEAEQSYKKALSIFRRLPDTNYEIAVALRNLGSVYSEDGRDSAALKIFQEALKLLKKNTRDEQVLAARIQNGIGMVYFRKGKIDKAQTLLAQAIGNRFAAMHDSDFVDAPILNNLGAIYQKQRKYAKAEESYKRSLELSERLLGSAHPYLASTLFNLGNLYTEMRRYSEAKDHYRRSLGILEQMSPVPDRRIVDTLEALSKIYLSEGEETNAEGMLARAVEIARRNPVPDPGMPTLLDAYADVLRGLGKINESQLLHAEARRTRAATALTIHVPEADAK